MKIIMLMVVLIVLSGCESLIQTKNYEYAWQGMHVIDVMQTISGVGSDDSDCHSEGNSLTRRIIGRHPDKEKIYAWGIGSAVIHYFLFKWVDNSKLSQDNKLGIRLFDTSLKLKTIGGNHRNGVRIAGKNKGACSRNPNSIKMKLYQW